MADFLVVEYGRRVSIEYTLRLDGGEVLESTPEGEPQTFMQGLEQVFPALEEALEGRAAGERVRLRLDPEQAYGQYDPALCGEVDLSMIPGDARRPGAEVVVQSPEGRSRHEGRVVEVRERTAVVDLNHPAAGRAVEVECRIVGIE